MIEWDKVYKNNLYGRPTQAISMVANMTPKLKAAGVESILDVGCGRGHLLECFSKAKFRVAGTEICESLIGKLPQQIPIFPLTATQLASTRVASDWDFICFVNVLPYLKDENEVRSTLKWARGAKHGLVVANSFIDDMAPLQWDTAKWLSVVGETDKTAKTLNAPHVTMKDRAYLVWQLH